MKRIEMDCKDKRVCNCSICIARRRNTAQAGAAKRREVERLRVLKEQERNKGIEIHILSSDELDEDY